MITNIVITRHSYRQAVHHGHNLRNLIGDRIKRHLREGVSILVREKEVIYYGSGDEREVVGLSIDAAAMLEILTEGKAPRLPFWCAVTIPDWATCPVQRRAMAVQS